MVDTGTLGEEEERINAMLEMVKSHWGKTGKLSAGTMDMEKARNMDELQMAFVQEMVRICRTYEDKRVAILYSGAEQESLELTSTAVAGAGRTPARRKSGVPNRRYRCDNSEEECQY
ncbi:MAG: hypothetical protein P4M11_04545 [Candidatus Pacebacteria bacterium]|nr:hypothetical protein [Candidatus Paceibacterota bacterium]